MTIQLAVKLPEKLVEGIDRLVGDGTFDSRSQAIRAGVEAVIIDRERRGVDQRYRDAFAKHPEAPEELAEAQRLAVQAIHDEPWEPWW